MIYCIHRKKDEERLKELIPELKSVGITPIYIEPEMPHNDFNKTSYFNSNMNSLRETTIKIIKKAKEEDLPYITIMEDDCKFKVTDYLNFKQYDLPETFDFIHLNVTGHQEYSIELHNKIFRKTLGSLCCQYYIINKQVYDYYLTLLEDNHMPIDEITRYLHRKRLCSYIVETLPVYHEKDKYSTLKDKIVKY